ncbi:MAG: aspartate-semialdehyde dehydrogenase [Defluviitaleaceae bacterium]|nr:aspartate-semialdehyde dehydrogenase [Defluviitaleaceae bacterium]
MNLAIVGATGVVGREFIKIIEQRDFVYDSLRLFSSARSAGSSMTVKGKDYIVEELTEDSGAEIDIALFSAGGGTSKRFAPIFADKGALVIDNSSAWRMEPDVPLVVPEVNPADAVLHKGIIANPNCSTIQAVVALKPLQDSYGLKRVVYSTYQSVSGAGAAGIRDLEQGILGNSPTNFKYPIAGNLIPQIDSFLENGYTKEEVKMVNETRKIMGLPNLRVTATTVRVPVVSAHSISINVELERTFDLPDVFRALREAKGIIVQDDPSAGVYPMPITAAGRDEVFVGRIRRDESVENGLNIWCVADNIRKGAALNAVQIAELIKNQRSITLNAV